jgi:hypothetical protein
VWGVVGPVVILGGAPPGGPPAPVLLVSSARQGLPVESPVGGLSLAQKTTMMSEDTALAETCLIPFRRLA